MGLGQRQIEVVEAKGDGDAEDGEQSRIAEGAGCWLPSAGCGLGGQGCVLNASGREMNPRPEVYRAQRPEAGRLSS